MNVSRRLVLVWLSPAVACCHWAYPFGHEATEPADSATTEGARDSGPDARDAGPGRLDRGADARDAEPAACAWSIEDDFELPLAETAIYRGCADISVEQREGALEIRLVADQPGICYGSYNFAEGAPVKLADRGSVRVRVVETVANQNRAEMGLTVTDGKWRVDLFFAEGELIFRDWEHMNHATIQATAVEFDPQAHQHWRIRHVPPAVAAWETSADGVSWTLQREDEVEMSFEKNEFWLWAGTPSQTPFPGVARFDDFAAEGECP